MTTWSTNPTDKYPSIVLSSNLLTATLTTALPSGVTDAGVRGTTSRANGFFEVVFTTLTTGAHNPGIAISNSAQSLTIYPHNPNACGWFADGYIGGPGIGVVGGAPSFAAGDVLGAEISGSNIKFYKNGTLVYTFTTIPTGSLFPYLSLTDVGHSAVANFGATAFAYFPSGAVSWDIAPISIPVTSGKINGVEIVGSGTSGSPLIWPSSLLKTDSVMFARRNLSRSGGLTITGVEQVVQSSSDYWQAQIRVKIRKDYQRLAYRALMARAFGRSTHWLIPVCSEAVQQGAFSSGFSLGFDAGAGAGQINATTATVQATMPLGSRSLVIRMEDISQYPVIGQYFSIGSRLYVVSSMSATQVGAFINITIAFAPGLRALAGTGTVLDFLSPKCRMRLAQDNIGDMTLDMLRFSEVTLDFVEIPA